MSAAPAGRFRFLRVNRFFDTTPLTGFSFISASKSIIEVTLWYGVIIFFLCITGINVMSTVMNYLSCPTRTYVQLATSTENASMGNLSFVLNTSLAEYSKITPTGLSFGHYLDAYPNLVQYLGCTLLPYFTKTDEMDSEIIRRSVIDWVEALALPWDQLQSNRSIEVEHLGQEGVVDGWLEDLENKAGELYDYIWEKRPLDYEHWLLDAAVNVINAPLRNRPSNTPYYLMLLSAIDQDKDPREKLFDSLAKYWIHIASRQQSYGSLDAVDYLWGVAADGHGYNWASERIQDFIRDTFRYNTTGSIYNSSTSDLVKELGLSASELLELTYSSMVYSIFFKTNSSNSEAVPIVLQEWDYEMKTWEWDHWIDLSTGLEGWQSLHLNALVPEKASKIEIEMHSYLFAWHQKVIQVFTNIVDANGWGALEKYAKIERCNQDEGEHFRTMWDNTFGYFNGHKLMNIIVDYYTRKYALMLENEFGNSLQLLPFHSYKIMMKPTAQLYSHTDSCYKNSYQFCVDECLSELYNEACNCIPWWLERFKGSNALCDMSCSSSETEKTCAAKCTQLLRHPCQLSLYQWEMTSRPTKPNTNYYYPVFDITIEKAQVFNHPHFIEEYALSKGEFFAQLGGAMEVWMGINVIGILHLIVYIVKQILHARDTDSTAAQSAARLFGKTHTITPEGTHTTETSHDMSDKVMEARMMQIAEQNNQLLRTEFKQLIKTEMELLQRKNNSNAAK